MKEGINVFCWRVFYSKQKIIGRFKYRDSFQVYLAKKTMKKNPVLRNKQTTLKKFVLPILLILVMQSAVLPSESDKNDFSKFILRISLTKTYPEAISMKKGNKSADWFIQKSKKGKPKELEKIINNTLLEKASLLVKRLFSQGVKLAIDITKIPVYTKSKSKFITHGNAEKGTTSFYQFLGFSIAERQLKFPVAFHLMQKEDFSNLYEIIRENLHIILQKIKINLIIMDRGFISSKIVQALQDLQCSFIIAFKRSKKFFKLFCALEKSKVNQKEEFFIQGLNQTVHRINSTCWVIRDYSYGKPSVKVNLIIWKAKLSKSKKKKPSKLKHEYFLYITSPNVEPEKVCSLYGTRWRIDCDVQRYLVEYRMSLNNSYLALRCLNEARWTCITGNGDVRSSVDNVPTEVIANFMWASLYTQEKLSVNS